MRYHALAVGLGILTSSCTPTDPGEMAALDGNAAKWQAASHSSYELLVERGPCECLAEDVIPVRVKVTNSAIVAVFDQRTGEVVTRELFHARTVDGLLELVRDAIAADAHRVSVRYDSVLGYPREIEIDYNADVADDEIRITANLTGVVGQ